MSKNSLSTVSIALAAILPLTAALQADDRPIISYDSPYPQFGEVERLDPALDELLAPTATMQKLAEGFNWSEGPAWDLINGKLYFSDVPENIAFQWKQGAGVSIFLSPSGFTGEVYNGYEPGSNGLTFDLNGNLVICQHGDRRVVRLNKGRRGYTTLVDNYEGKRFNSPNDVCFDSEGNFYFTDPPYGMTPATVRELDYHGVYKVTPSGEITLLTAELARPNGIALSPDDKTLYVTSTDGSLPVVMAYPIQDNGTLGEGSIFWDNRKLYAKGRSGGSDGLRTDVHGNVWTTAAGGVVILNSDGKMLGSLLTGRATANLTFGGNDGSMLYITADDVLCRIPTKVKGYFPGR